MKDGLSTFFFALELGLFGMGDRSFLVSHLFWILWTSFPLLWNLCFFFPEHVAHAIDFFEFVLGSIGLNIAGHYSYPLKFLSQFKSQIKHFCVQPQDDDILWNFLTLFSLLLKLAHDLESSLLQHLHILSFEANLFVIWEIDFYLFLFFSLFQCLIWNEQVSFPFLKNL